MSPDIVVTGPRTRTRRAGWGWLLLTTVSRMYLIFLGSLAACALLPMLAGLSGSVVQSGSMEPHINAGDVVLSRAMPAEAPPPMGRVITFRAPAGSAKSGFVLHRLVAANVDGSLVTAGDANAAEDSTPLDRRNIISQACLLIPWVGLPAFWATTGTFLPLGIWVLLTIGAILVGAVDGASRLPPTNRGRWSRSGGGPEDPSAESQAARSRRESVSSLFNRVRVFIGPAASVLVAALMVSALVTAPVGQAAAAFSARTSSAGNSWGTAGPATRLVFTTDPSSSTGGVAFATQPVVAVQAADGATVTVSSAPVTLSITTPAGAVLSCTANPKNAVAGVATFAGCRVDKTGTYTLTATSGTLTTDVSASFTVSIGPATKLGFTRTPSNTAVNTAFASQPRVAIQDAGGNTRTASSASVLLSITPPSGGAALTSCSSNPRSTSSGVASFASCRINTAGSYTLTATAAGLTAAVSTSFSISGTATKLAFTASPSGSTGGTAFATQPVVAVQDAGGNTTAGTNAVTLAITTPAGAVLACTSNPLNAVLGVATFAGCKVDKIGTYTLTATASGLTNGVSASFTITVGPATKLAFTTNPSASTGGTAFGTQPVVKVQDAGANTVTSSSAPITLSITTPAEATLTCTANPKAAVAGVAAFAGCRIDRTGTYTLTAASSGLTSAVSANVTITVGAATKLGFTTSPPNTARNTVFATQPVVAIQDAGGNTRTASSGSVTLTITPPAGGATLTCTTNPRSTTLGVATFADCRIDTPGTYTLTATASGLTAAVSAIFTIT